jgi:4-amino-4-deoxy-L-arabinose transferase-like glycosyltransferase
MNHTRKIYLLVALVGVLSLAIRLWMLDKHWINPDEGAHLMDALLALSGKIPMVDYDSRQPLYTYSLAGVLHLFGHGFETGRLLSCICSFLTGMVVYLLGKVLFNEKTAAVAAVIYFILPLEFMNSTMVKTEPLTVLLTCTSFLALSLAHRSKHNIWLILAGITAALCFYVRQSAIIIPAAAVIVFISGIFIHTSAGRIRPIVYFILGYAATVLMITALYLHVAGFNPKIVSELNPFGFVHITLKKGGIILLESLGLLQIDSTGQAANQLPNKYPLYWRYVKDAISMHLFLIVGAAGAFIQVVARQSRSSDTHSQPTRRSCALLFVWLGLMVAAYAYFLYVKGFHIDYFREFIPPLVLLFAAWARSGDWSLQTTSPGRVCAIIVFGFILPVGLHTLLPIRFGPGTVTTLGMALFVLIFLTPRVSVGKRMMFGLSILTLAALICVLGLLNLQAGPPLKIIRFVLLAGVVFLPFLFMEKHQKETIGARYHPVVHTIVIGAVVFSISTSMKVVDWSYTAPWPPDSVYRSAAFLKAHTAMDDRIMSGSVIWEVQSNRHPFLDITHPLNVPKITDGNQLKKIEHAIKSGRPKVIVLDGYTEKTYLTRFPWLRQHIGSAYSLQHRAEGGKFPVEIYLKD